MRLQQGLDRDNAWTDLGTVEYGRYQSPLALAGGYAALHPKKGASALTYALVL